KGAARIRPWPEGGALGRRGRGFRQRRALWKWPGRQPYGGQGAPPDPGRRPRPLRTGTVLPKGLALPVGLDHDLALFVQADPDPLHLLLHLAARLADAEVDVGADPPGFEHPVLDELQRGDGPRLGAYRVELPAPRLDPEGPPDELGAGGQDPQPGVNLGVVDGLPRHMEGAAGDEAGVLQGVDGDGGRPGRVVLEL